jgi:hypothetical protein
VHSVTDLARPDILLNKAGEFCAGINAFRVDLLRRNNAGFRPGLTFAQTLEAAGRAYRLLKK